MKIQSLAARRQAPPCPNRDALAGTCRPATRRAFTPAPPGGQASRHPVCLRMGPQSRRYRAQGARRPRPSRRGATGIAPAPPGHPRRRHARCLRPGPGPLRFAAVGPHRCPSDWRGTKGIARSAQPRFAEHLTWLQGVMASSSSGRGLNHVDQALAMTTAAPSKGKGLFAHTARHYSASDRWAHTGARPTGGGATGAARACGRVPTCPRCRAEGAQRPPPVRGAPGAVGRRDSAAAAPDMTGPGRVGGACRGARKAGGGCPSRWAHGPRPRQARANTRHGASGWFMLPGRSNAARAWFGLRLAKPVRVQARARPDPGRHEGRSTVGHRHHRGKRKPT